MNNRTMVVLLIFALLLGTSAVLLMHRRHVKLTPTAPPKFVEPPTVDGRFRPANFPRRKRSADEKPFDFTTIFARSGPVWSGEFNSFGDWHTLTLGPVPNGWQIEEVDMEVWGDRHCLAGDYSPNPVCDYMEMAQVSRNAASATWHVHTQGHTDSFLSQRLLNRTQVNAGGLCDDGTYVRANKGQATSRAFLSAFIICIDPCPTPRPSAGPCEGSNN